MFVIGSPQSKMGIHRKHEQGWVERSSCIYFTQTPAHKMVFQTSQTEYQNRLKILSLIGTGSTQNPKSAANCSEFQGEHMVPPPPHYYRHWHLWDWKYARAHEKLKKVLEEMVLLSWQHPLPPHSIWIEKDKFLVVLFWYKKRENSAHPTPHDTWCFLTVPPLKVLSVRLHSKSHQKDMSEFPKDF